MPPQVKISKEKIKETAFKMTCENGFESVTARKLAERLNCSTQPIFRVYESMEALKADLYEMGTEYARGKMFGGSLSTIQTISKVQTPSKKTAKTTGITITYLTAGMAYIQLAKCEAHLFRLIGAVDDLGILGDGSFLLKGEARRLEGFLPGADGLTDVGKDMLLTIIWSLIHGIATLVVSGRAGYSDDEMRGYITTAYDGLLCELKGK